MTGFINRNDRVLFIGDSVTDCGRARTTEIDGSAEMGNGYPFLISAWYNALYPEKCVTFLNRGISGNRVRDLRQRWQSDCLDLKPNVVSILIGINDTWRRYDSNDPTSTEAYEKDFRSLLDATRTAGMRVILCEPFCLPFPEDRRAWRVDLDPRIQVVRRLALEYQTQLLPLDGIFAQAAAKRHPAFWLSDGVHPTPAGHALIAQNWIAAVNAAD